MAKKQFIPCVLKQLPAQQLVQAAAVAHRVNPANKPELSNAVTAFSALGNVTPERIAILTSKYWGLAGARLTVAFLDNVSNAFANKCLQVMNAWSNPAPGILSSVSFALTNSVSNAHVRIAREASGYWSYLGTDILTIPRNQQTMNLQGFTERTSNAEWSRVVKHETGHTLGMPHEHMRQELVDRLDVQATIRYFRQTQGWSAAETRAQVLTPIDKRSLLSVPGFDRADQDSIMCYQLPGSITKDGEPIRGGVDINNMDAQYIARVYPDVNTPVDPTDPTDPTGPTDPTDPTGPTGPTELDIDALIDEIFGRRKFKIVPIID